MKLSPAGQLPPAINTQANPLPAESVSDNALAEAPPPLSVRINISKEAREKLEAEKYADIDKAPLPDDIKEVLKTIRKLQEKIAKVSDELASVMSNTSLSEDERKRKQQTLSAELQSLQGALSDTTSALNNAMSQHTMTGESRRLAKSLIGLK
ncbi:hypothetical protein ACW9IB_01340 [Pseudomonas sp. SDO524_S393]